jgi:GntR family transcriptional regulator
MSHLACLGVVALPWLPTVVRVTIDPLGETPVYLQLADILRDRIGSGELQPNRPIPSLVTLQQEYGIARGTAAKAVRKLVEEKLVKIVPGRGAYVTTRTPAS